MNTPKHIEQEMKKFLDPYQQFIAKSRYSRFLDDKKRREDFHETVDRYIDFFQAHMKNRFGHLIDTESIRKSLIEMSVMPSMRALMTAGKALERDNTAGYNCAYLPVDDFRAFDETLHILSCGTGVGFSVENRYVSKLPVIPETLVYSDETILVADSKEGWAKGLRQLVSHLYAGIIPKYDTSKVRKKGSRLKTFGGRASGPEPLIDLFEFVIATFKKAAGRKLTSIECHDIMCKIAEVIVVGGVRRSALISLSDLEDDRMREAKSGNWWDHTPHRKLANNSVAYDRKPDIGQFMKEWHSLYASFSGERGIFSREAAHRYISKSGRRSLDWLFGTNPCSEIILRPNQFCNLTSVVIRPTDTLNDLLAKVRIATILGTYQSTLSKFPYLRKTWERNTEEERLLGVSLTGMCDHPVLSRVSKESTQWLQAMREEAKRVNFELADELMIPRSAAITCVKPEGTASQLNDSASGMHTRFAQYYKRRVRNDKKDPITDFLIQAGVPCEDEIGSDNTVVFTFPRKAPETALFRDAFTAIEQLEYWLHIQENWCEHKPSVTVYIKDHEWMDVGAWVWNNFDSVSGVSFLPYDGGVYKQAPYEEIDKDTYEELIKTMPTSIDWDLLIEDTDNVEGVQTLACSNGVCEI